MCYTRARGRAVQSSTLGARRWFMLPSSACREPSIASQFPGPLKVERLAVEHASLNRVHQVAAVASLFPVVSVDEAAARCSVCYALLPVVAEDPNPRQFLDRDLGLARPVRAHQTCVLTGAE